MCVLIAIYRVYNRFFKSNFILFGNFQKPKYIPSNTHTHTPKHIPTMVLRYELKETKRSANATLIRFSCDEFGFLHRNTKQKRKIDRENNCVISSGLPFLCGFTTFTPSASFSTLFFFSPKKKKTQPNHIHTKYIIHIIYEEPYNRFETFNNTSKTYYILQMKQFYRTYNISRIIAFTQFNVPANVNYSESDCRHPSSTIFLICFFFRRKSFALYQFAMDVKKCVSVS